MAQTRHNGFAIRDFRLTRGMTVDDLAKQTDISAPHLRNIENEHRDASDEHLNRIARVLDVRVAALRRVSRADDNQAVSA